MGWLTQKWTKSFSAVISTFTTDIKYNRKVSTWCVKADTRGQIKLVPVTLLHLNLGFRILLSKLTRSSNFTAQENVFPLFLLYLTQYPPPSPQLICITKCITV
ncbi:unnamed protein product, partial [Lymnaea stagnalis]